MTTDADRRRALACLDLLLSAIGSQRADHYMDAYNTVRAALGEREWKPIETCPIAHRAIFYNQMWASKEYPGMKNGSEDQVYLDGFPEGWQTWATHWREKYPPPAQQQNSGGSYGAAASPSEGMEPSSNAGSPESRPDAHSVLP